MGRLILIPHDIGRPVRVVLQRTFEDGDFRILYLSEDLEPNVDEIRERIVGLVNEDDEIYLILGGAYLAVAVAIRYLELLGVRYKMLLFDKKNKKYLILDSSGNVVGDGGDSV